MKSLFRLFRYAKAYRFYFVIAILCVIIESAFELIIPMIMANIIDVGLVNKDIEYILYQGILMGILAIISLIFGLLYAKFNAKAANGFGAELRKAEFEKIQEYSFINIDHFDTSSLITRLTSDVTVIQNAISGGLRPITRGPVMLILGLLFSFMINGELVLVFLIATPILAFILFLIVTKVAPKYAILQKAVDKLNIVVEEDLNAIRVVKAFVREDYESLKFDKVNSGLKETTKNTFSKAMLNMPSFQLVMYTTIVFILFFGANLIYVGKMQVGELTGFMSYVLQIMNSLMMISNVFLMMTRSLASAKRINEVFDEKLDLIGGSLNEMPKSGKIDFDHVYFKYASDAREYVLSDIDLHIKAGETIGIIGGTGSAKSSLVQLIPRLYDVSEGKVLIDDVDVKDYDLTKLRDAVSIVLQKNVLFSGTIKENLLWGNKDASDEEIAWAIKASAADEFVYDLKDGLDTYIEEGGTNVSGGQKQRLCIARSLLKRPKIIIFDDSTSAVDTATDSKIQDGLRSIKDMTKIIIAQRINSVMNADRIIILDDGKVAAFDTHEKLLKENEIYKDLYESQMKGGENNG